MTRVRAEYDHNGGTYWLLAHIHDQETLRYKFTVWLTQLYEHERDLNTGRFHMMQRGDWEHVVQLRGEDFVRAYFDDTLDWIAENCQGRWDIFVEEDRGFLVPLSAVSFLFENVTDAVAFKLARG